MRALRAPAEERSNKAARLAQALERPEEARTAEHGPGGTWEALRQWLALSDRAYQALIQRLARGAEKTAHAAAPVMPLAREENVDAGARFWWWRGRGLFDAMMRRLAEGGAPPESAPTHRSPTPPVAEQGAARNGTAGPPVSAAAVATAHVPDQGPVATGPGARDAEKGSAGADRAGAPPARLAVVPRARRPAASSATLAAGGARSDTGKRVAERRAQRARLRGHARSASKPRHAAWHGTVHGTGYAARYAAWRMADGALRAKQRRAPHRGMRRVAAHRVHRCAQAGRRGPLPGWYVVAKGDTLWQIARRHYGSGRRYVRIAAANRHRLRGQDRIVPCQRLFLPRASRRH